MRQPSFYHAVIIRQGVKELSEKERIYIAIDLKSFYASVECRERNLDPLTTNLVVADASRTEKTICLAVSPSLKAFGIPGRPRLFQVVQRVRECNMERLNKAIHKGLAEKDRDGKYQFKGSSWNAEELDRDPGLEISYITAVPRMQTYMDYSTGIYNVYLKYISPEDIHVYSIDEVFIDATDYLDLYRMTAEELARKMILDVLHTTGITAAAGIGTNLYLAKTAMDIMAKHVPADENGVRIASLDERTYRKELWTHRPLTDFWRVGRGISKKLEENGLYTMGDIARISVSRDNYRNEDLLYRLFGVNAELLIDHAWGWEPVTMRHIKEYKPETSTLGSGQVLPCGYPYDKTRIVAREMTEHLVLDLVDKGLVTDQIVLTVSYDRNIPEGSSYAGPMGSDFYGRTVPKSAHGSVNLGKPTSSTKRITEKTLGLFDEIVNRSLLARKLYVTANHVVPKDSVPEIPEFQQLSLFTDYEQQEKQEREEKAELEKEQKLQEAMLSIKKKYGKNAVLKGLSFREGATERERNQEIGGHKA